LAGVCSALAFGRPRIGGAHDRILPDLLPCASVVLPEGALGAPRHAEADQACGRRRGGEVGRVLRLVRRAPRVRTARVPVRDEVVPGAVPRRRPLAAGQDRHARPGHLRGRPEGGDGASRASCPRR
jgi:hypothetical protein